jgi:dephospho-CoA kinase
MPPVTKIISMSPASAAPTGNLARASDAETIADAYVYLLGRILCLRQEHLDRRAPGFAYNQVKYNPLGSADFVNPNLDVAYLEAWFGLDDHTTAILEVPEIRGRYYTAQIIDDAGPDAVVVHDMPLLVEKGMGADYHLVVVVGAAEEVRVRRLVDQRGMSAADARARIAAQADDDARRAAADVWLSNEATPEALRAVVLRLWHERVEPFELNTSLTSRSA